MPYQYRATVTSKGQITIPKAVRERLHLDRTAQIILEIPRSNSVVRIRPSLDFLEIAKQLSKKVKKKARVNPEKARFLKEKTYGRI